MADTQPLLPGDDKLGHQVRTPGRATRLARTPLRLQRRVSICSRQHHRLLTGVPLAACRPLRGSPHTPFPAPQLGNRPPPPPPQGPVAIAYQTEPHLDKKHKHVASNTTKITLVALDCLFLGRRRTSSIPAALPPHLASEGRTAARRCCPRMQHCVRPRASAPRARMHACARRRRDAARAGAPEQEQQRAVLVQPSGRQLPGRAGQDHLCPHHAAAAGALPRRGHPAMATSQHTGAVWAARRSQHVRSHSRELAC